MIKDLIETEYGLEWTIGDGVIRYVGAYMGMPHWNNQRIACTGYFDPNKETNINYVSKEG